MLRMRGWAAAVLTACIFVMVFKGEVKLISCTQNYGVDVWMLNMITLKKRIVL